MSPEMKNMIDKAVSILGIKRVIYSLQSGKELFKIDTDKLKKVIDDCYCKHVSVKENKLLYDEISSLLGMYVYVKDKINIKPYIIIGKNL